MGGTPEASGRHMSVGSLVSSGPLILAVPVAAAAGAVTFLSPCCLPLVPGYLSYVTGMSGAGAGSDSGRRTVATPSARPVGACSGAEPASSQTAGSQTAGSQTGGSQTADSQTGGAGAVLALAYTSGTAARGAFLAFIYCLGLGVPFLVVAMAFQRGLRAFGFARRHARLVTAIGGGILMAVGLLEVTGAWTAAVTWLQIHWLSRYSSPV